MKNKMPFSVVNISVRIDPCGFQYLFGDTDVMDCTQQVHIDHFICTMWLFVY